MSSFLGRIIEQKKREVDALYRDLASHRQSQAQGTHQIQKRNHKQFKSEIEAPFRMSVISEIKRASPSKGMINADFDIAARARAYEKGGAAAISVLTDACYFLGSVNDLQTVSGVVNIPILRKDFIIDTIQIDESLQIGADAILLIAAALTGDTLAKLSEYAQHLGLDVLIEVHHISEMEAALAANPSVVGINNRDLNTFEVSLDTTVQILKGWQYSHPVISESGFSTANDVRRIAAYGIDGILVGESLMRLTSLETIQSTIALLSTLPDNRLTSGCQA